ncbi:MAG: sulfotransferase [Myxococcota bacterium]
MRHGARLSSPSPRRPADRPRRAARRAGTTPPRWLFKDSTHLFALDALLATYPDARIVQTHRDPAQVPVCSLCWSSRAPLNETDDRKVFGRATLDLWQRGMDDFLRVRKQDEARHPERYLDLPFARFIIDPIAAIREIHERFDLPGTGRPSRPCAAWRRAPARPTWGIATGSRSGTSRPMIEALHSPTRGDSMSPGGCFVSPHPTRTTRARNGRTP